MKKAASFAARVAVAVMIAAAVAFAQYWIWQQLNRSAEFIGTNQSIKGFAYNGFQRDQSPLKGTTRPARTSPPISTCSAACPMACAPTA